MVTIRKLTLIFLILFRNVTTPILWHQATTRTGSSTQPVQLNTSPVLKKIKGRGAKDAMTIITSSDKGVKRCCIQMLKPPDLKVLVRRVGSSLGPRHTMPTLAIDKDLCVLTPQRCFKNYGTTQKILEMGVLASKVPRKYASSFFLKVPIIIIKLPLRPLHLQAYPGEKYPGKMG